VLKQQQLLVAPLTSIALNVVETCFVLRKIPPPPQLREFAKLPSQHLQLLAATASLIAGLDWCAPPTKTALVPTRLANQLLLVVFVMLPRIVNYHMVVPASAVPSSASPPLPPNQSSMLSLPSLYASFQTVPLSPTMPFWEPAHFNTAQVFSPLLEALIHAGTSTV